MYEKNIFDMPFIIRAIQIKERIQKLNQYFQIKEKFPVVSEMILLIIVILVMAHIFGCGFYWAGTYDAFYGKNSWIIYYEVEQQDLMDKYVTSIYFTFISMITVGYGDIAPVTTNERLYVIMMTLISCGIFGYCINQLSSIIQELQAKKNKMENQRKLVKNYLQSRKINQQIQFKILKNLEYKGEDKFSHDKEAQNVLSKIDPLLLQEYKQEYCGSIISNIKVFKKFTDITLKNISSITKECNYQTGDILFQQEDLIEYLFILMEGEIELFSDAQDSYTLGPIEKEKCISLNGFLQGGFYSASARFKKESRVVSIYRKDFLNVVKKMDRDYEHFCDIRDSIIYDEFYNQQAETCKFCKNATHDQKDCTQLHAKINKQLVIQRYMATDSYSESKKEFKRKQKNKKIHNPKLNNYRNRINLKKIRLDILFIIQGYETFEKELDIQNLQSHNQDKQFLKNTPSIPKNYIDRDKFCQIHDINDKIIQIEQNESHLNMNNEQIAQLTHLVQDLHDLQNEFLIAEQYSKPFVLSLSKCQSSTDEMEDDQQSIGSKQSFNNNHTQNNSSRNYKKQHNNNQQGQISQNNFSNPRRQSIQQIKNNMQRSSITNQNLIYPQGGQRLRKSIMLPRKNNGKQPTIIQQNNPIQALLQIQASNQITSSGITGNSVYQINNSGNQISQQLQQQQFNQQTYSRKTLKSQQSQDKHEQNLNKQFTNNNQNDNLKYISNTDIELLSNQYDTVYDKIKQFQFYKIQNNFKFVIRKYESKQRAMLFSLIASKAKRKPKVTQTKMYVTQSTRIKNSSKKNVTQMYSENTPQK